MTDDARVVLEWMGRTKEPSPTFEHNGGNSWTWTEGRFKIDFRTDANWIHGVLVPALEERLGLWLIARLHDGEVRLTFKRSDYAYHPGTGPTFEAAFLAAAAKAVSDDR